MRGCPYPSSPANATELGQYRVDRSKISQVLPGLSCKEFPAAKVNPQHSCPRCRCHSPPQSVTVTSSNQDRLPWKPVCLSDAHGTNPSPAIPSNQEASGCLHGDVLASPSHGQAESENPSSLPKTALSGTQRPGQLWHHPTSSSRRNSVGFTISHLFLLFVLWQILYKKK